MNNSIESYRSSEKIPVTNEEVLTRGVDKILPDKSGLEALMENRQVHLYLGVDPTSTELHIGHTVPLRKLRQFQDTGHKVTFLFGDFTALIGDPTDKTASRVRQTPEQVAHNMATYLEQVGRILDLSPQAKNPIEIRKNSEWLAGLTLSEILDIQANFSVQQMLERSMFQKRLEDKKPIWLHEFSYPWMQGWDAVAMDVDLEIGGKDQLFNMLVGRELILRYKKHEKWVMALDLIEDPNGKKMGKTEGNIVNINDWSEVKYEAIMTWPDTAIGMGFELITSVPMDLVYKVKEEILPAVLAGNSSINPMALKEALAYRVVAELDGNNAADEAAIEFDRVKRQKLLPRRIREVQVDQGKKLTNILIASKLATDEDDAQKKIAQGGVLVDGKIVQKNIQMNTPDTIVQIGKKLLKISDELNLAKFSSSCILISEDLFSAGSLT